MLRISRRHAAKNLRKTHAVKNSIQNILKKITTINRKVLVMMIAAPIAQCVTAL